MALLTKTNLETMDYSYGGVPFVSVPAKAGINLDGLDYSFAGIPFWALEVSSGSLQNLILSCEPGSYLLTGTDATLTVTKAAQKQSVILGGDFISDISLLGRFDSDFVLGGNTDDGVALIGKI